MNLLRICILISSFSFFAYAYSYFKSPHMKNEFKRFGIEKMGLAIVILEIIGALGLLAGLKFNFILIVSSFGLALLMFAGIIVRMKLKDNIWITFPALFYMLLNGYIFLLSIKFQI